LPSRSSIRRNRFIGKWGRQFLDKYPELWSFAYGPMRSSYYAGWILTFMPVMGLQITLAIILAIFLRANVMILVALQMLSNPFTIGFLWTFEYHIGKFILSFLPHQQSTLIEVTLAETVQKSFTGHSFVKATLAICLGGLVLGILCGKLSCLLHQYILKRTVVTYEEFIQQKMDSLKRLQKKSDDFIGKA
jgi:uncharacterized protein (DUF2062 family)